MDLFELTQEQKYLDAVDGFWEMFRAGWLHVGGTYDRAGCMIVQGV
jgi:hypothetical protein